MAVEKKTLDNNLPSMPAPLSCLQDLDSTSSRRDICLQLSCSSQVWTKPEHRHRIFKTVLLTSCIDRMHLSACIPNSLVVSRFHFAGLKPPHHYVAGHKTYLPAVSKLILRCHESQGIHKLSAPCCQCVCILHVTLFQLSQFSCSRSW